MESALWSPNGRDVLLTLPLGDGQERVWSLWLIPINGDQPTRIAFEGKPLGWTPDGSRIVWWTSIRSAAQPPTPALAFSDRGGRLLWSIRLRDQPRQVLATAAEVVLVHDGALWRIPYGGEPGSEPMCMHELPDIDERLADGIALAPGNDQLAYA